MASSVDPLTGICLNEDIAHFYANHPEADMTAEGCDALVDYYAQFADLTALMFCTNVQRALFSSRVWERVYDGYDPDAGPDQPVLQWLKDPLDRELTLGSQGRCWIHNLQLLERRGVDHLERWLARSRHRGIEGWLSVRMNDLHFNHIPDAFWHAALWRQRPDLWVVPGGTGSGRAYDYSHPEVRDHHLSLIRELLARYDLFGIELDWIRTPPYFPPGTERERRQVLTDFTAEVRDLANAAGARLGHPVKVGARIPTRMQSGRGMGLDGLAWAREGLVDQLVLSSLAGVIEFDMPVLEWKRTLGDLPVGVVAQFGTCSYSFPGGVERGPDAQVQSTPEYLRGAAASAFGQGADRVYLFNHCYFESEVGRRDRLRQILETIGSPQALAGRPRRHAVTYPEMTADDEPDFAALPVDLATNEHALFEVGVGAVPEVWWSAVVLGFDRELDSPGPQDLSVSVNGTVCRYIQVVPPGEPPGDLPYIADPRLSFAIPAGVLHAGANRVEVGCSVDKGTIVWCEIYLG